MSDTRLDRLAEILVNYSVAVRKGDRVVIHGSTICEPLAIACYRETLKAGGHPWVRLQPDELSEVFYKSANESQLDNLNPFDKYIIRECNVRIGFWGEENTKALSNVDPARQARHSKARQPIMAVFFKRAALPAGDPNKLRWTGTQYPTHASAQDAEMSLAEYEDFIYRSCKLHARDPIAAWKRLGAAQQRLADHLNKCRELHITAPNGTDIRFGIAGRRWINCDGHENFPDGEVFTGPIEDATEGTVCYSFPAVEGGREVEGIRLTFRTGRVVDCSATKNEEFLIQMLDQDRGARVLGEVALGSNYDITRYTKSTLFDEKIGGTFHAAVGASYPESGGRNQSALHWDMVCDLRHGGVVRADGKVISRKGRFAKAAWPR